MLFRSFAHLLLLIFGLVLIATVLVTITTFGWLGANNKAEIEAIWSVAQEFYGANKVAIDRTAAVSGILGSALTGAFAIYKSWHYAEISLPSRLEELIARNTNRQLTNRRQLLPILNGDSTFRGRWSTSADDGLLARLLSYLALPANDLAAASGAKIDLLNDLRVLDDARKKCVVEVCTAHLASGFQIARTGKDGQRAAAEFNLALKFDPKDLDSLELAAREAFAPGTNNSLAMRYLRELSSAALEAHDVVRHSRALRFQAEALLERQVQRAWDDARTKLTTAIKTLQEQAVEDKSAKELELALAFELLATAQMKRERLSAARSALNSARLHFNGAVRSSRRRSIKRLKKFEIDLSQAEKDRDNPNVAD
jgi:hypothetical protein